MTPEQKLKEIIKEIRIDIKEWLLLGSHPTSPCIKNYKEKLALAESLKSSLFLLRSATFCGCSCGECDKLKKINAKQISKILEGGK